MEVTETKDEHIIKTSGYAEVFRPRMMDWNATKIFASKNLRIAIRYPTNWIIWGFLPILWFAPYVLMMTAIAGPGTSEHFAELSGFNDFITFSVIGWFCYQFVDKSVWSIGNNFRWEQFSGTLEPLFVIPVPRISILVGAAVSDTVQCTLSAVVLLFASCFVFSVTYAVTAIAPIILILTMMVIALYGFSFMLAGLILVFKDPSVLTELVSNLTYVLSPVTYPIQALPASARIAAYIVPSTIAMVTVRELAITGVFEPFALLQAVGALGLIILGFWSLGILAFRYAEKWTKITGSLGEF